MPSVKQKSNRRSDRDKTRLLQLRREFQSRGVSSTAELSLRVESVNEADRSVRAVIATNRPVLVPDWDRGEMVDEILVIEGMQSAPAVPLLDNHSRWSLDDQIGGVDEIQANPTRGEVESRLRFSDFGKDDEVGKRQERNWQRVREGFARQVSAGYRALAAEYIRAGQSTTINGRTYTAGQRTLKVTTSWMLREVSLVPVGADPAALIRAFHGGAKMPQTQQNPAEETRGEQSGTTAAPTFPSASGVAAPASPTIISVDEAIRTERERVAEIRRMFTGETRTDLEQRAINEGWSTDRAGRELLTAIRGERSQAVERQQVPAIHSRSHEADCNKDTLSLVLLRKMDVAMDSPVFGSRAHREAMPEILRHGINSDERQRAMENADRFSDMSLMDIAGEACRMAGLPTTYNRIDLIKRAFSTAELGDIFTNSISAAVLAGYVEASDSTVAWTSEADVPNFLTNERHNIGKFGRLKQLKTGGTAEDLSTSSSKEEYKVKRYAGKFTVDEQDFINDTMGAMDQLAPVDMGAAARQLRPDLVYSILLANASLVDSVALFHSTHANVLTSSALTTLTLGNALQLMLKQRIEGRPLSLRPRFLMVPADLLLTADNVVSSQKRADTTSGAGSDNVISKYGITVVADDRLGAAGVTNPDGSAVLTGSATTWFTAARPGENGAKTIEVGFIRGSGRAPSVRSYMLSQGQYGMGWDVNLDIGAKALDFRAMTRATA